MILNTMKVHSVNESCYVYIPKVWVALENLKKGDTIIWSVNEGDHRTLLLKKNVNGG
jgi:bifunctional DNA-binding transcriptional regulator/antitoxin component of YhaV-PrlF toxin-antitoxin module